MDFTDKDILKLKRLIKNFNGLVLPLKRFRGNINLSSIPPREETLKHGDYFKCSEEGTFIHFTNYDRYSIIANVDDFIVYNKIIRSYDKSTRKEATTITPSKPKEIKFSNLQVLIVEHEFNTEYPDYYLETLDGEVLVPERVERISKNKFEIHFNPKVSGRIIVYNT